MSQRYYLRAAGHKYNMGRGRGKHKTGRGGKFVIADGIWPPHSQASSEATVQKDLKCFD
jgi:hypothetical protein